MADGAERQSRYLQRQRERGLVQITVTVPTHRLAMFKRLAARLRDRHEAEQSDD